MVRALYVSNSVHPQISDTLCAFKLENALSLSSHPLSGVLSFCSACHFILSGMQVVPAWQVASVSAHAFQERCCESRDRCHFCLLGLSCIVSELRLVPPGQGS